MDCSCYLRNVQDVLADGKTLCERGFGEPFRGPTIPFGSMIKYHPISAKDLSRLHQFGKKILPGIFLACALIAGEFGKEIFWLQKLRNRKSWTHQQLSSKNQCERSIDTTKGEEFKFQTADGTAKVSRRDCEFREPTLRRRNTWMRENLRGEFQGEREESQPTELRDEAEGRADFWSVQGDFIYRHHNEPRVQLHVPKEETFFMPLKYIDVTRYTHTNLDVLQEKRIDYHWNVDANRSFSDSRKGLTKFILHKEKPLKGYMGLEGDWQKFKRPLDQTMCGLKYGLQLVKSLRREREARMGKREVETR